MIAVAVLAAGKGTRMKSSLPKVLHELGGQTLVERVLNSVTPLDPQHQIVIVGYGAEKVQEIFSEEPSVRFVEQQEQLGTGHAVQQLLPHLQGFDGDLLVLNGDVPLLRTETLQAMLQTHQTHQNDATILTAHLPNPKGYGRVFCDSQNILTAIVEDRDCSVAQKQNHRINAGVYCFRWSKLAEILPRLTNDNDQQEYYLTDTVDLLSTVMAFDVEDAQEIRGINDRKQLSAANQVLQDRIKEQWMIAGVTLIDPASITIDDTVVLHPDVVVEPQTHLRGHTEIQSGSRIGPGTLIENSQIESGVSVQYSVISDSHVSSGSRVGPYAHLRGQVQIGANCRIGNFVELKKTKLGQKTNVAHLSYLGDTTAGERVNIGAGTITANYDGVNKHPTYIGDRTKTGSNSVLVAPVTLGTDVNVAAGSTVTDDVENDALVIARSRQVVKPGWQLQSKDKG